MSGRVGGVSGGGGVGCPGCGGSGTGGWGVVGGSVGGGTCCIDLLSIASERLLAAMGCWAARVAHWPILAIGPVLRGLARVAELVDALDLGSSIARCGGSSPSARTIFHAQAILAIAEHGNRQLASFLWD